MSEKLGAMLVHGYRAQYREAPEISMGGRNDLQAATTAAMVHTGQVEHVVVFGGHWWGRKKSAFAQGFSSALQARGVPESQVTAIPRGRSTTSELRGFKRLAEREGWSAPLGSLATADHRPRVTMLMQRKIPTVVALTSENVLERTMTGADLGAKAVAEAERLLTHFRNPANTKSYRDKEEKLIRITQLGLGWILSLVGGLPVIRQMQNALDE